MQIKRGADATFCKCGGVSDGKKVLLPEQQRFVVLTLTICFFLSVTPP
jgi:hypothetical protein